MKPFALAGFLITLVAFPGVTFAETSTPDVDGSLPREDRIETDRNSFTPATEIAGLQRLIVESSYTFVNNRVGPDEHSFPELLFRYGLCSRVEVRLGWNYELGGGGGEVSGISNEDTFSHESGGSTRAHSISYGLKIQLTEQKEWIPDSVCILEGFTPTGGPETATHSVATYALGWELPARWKLDAALRYGTETAEDDHFDNWAPSVVLRIPLCERWSVHAEYFGFFSTNKQENFTRHFFSPGLHYLVTDNLEIGTRVGWGLNDQSSRFFCNAGVGYRF